MSRIECAISEIHHMDRISSRDQWVNQLHPLVKFIVTVCYIAVTVSFSKYDVLGLAGMSIYPIAMFLLADLSIWNCIRRLRVVLPFVCFIGILNPLFDSDLIVLDGITMHSGVLSMITLIMKGIFCLLASYLLITTTSIESLCYAFQLLHVPNIFVTQILLTYRYITLLLEEANRMMQAYSLRAPNQNGVAITAWGSLAGQLLLRSVDRANAVYESMVLRGYTGSFAYMQEKAKLRQQDSIYCLIWLALLLVFRQYPIFLLIGGLFA